MRAAAPVRKPPQQDHLSNGFGNADSKIKTDAGFDVDSDDDNDAEGNDDYNGAVVVHVAQGDDDDAAVHVAQGDGNGAVVHVAHGLKATRCKMLPQFHFQLQH